MKKRAILFIVLVAIGAAAVFNANIGLHGNSFSDITLDNIEALAKNESSDCFGIEMLNCRIWDVTYYNSEHIMCVPGGNFYCAFP